VFLERRCPGCGRDSRFVCESCWQQLRPAAGRSLFQYDDLGRSIVLAAKNSGRRDLWRPLGRALAAEVVEPVDLVTWVPASRTHRQERGYDQGRLLARSVARRLGVPHRRLLRRADRRSQTGQSRDQRLVGPSLTVTGRPPPGRVLLVDDVRTTGASLRAGVVALRSAGFTAVTVMTVAAVDPRSSAGEHQRAA
jgi:predicted amidophosphoribosyltransferase